MQIIETLKSLASKNRTIVCTIHQPQSEIVQHFDKLLLLANGGNLVYFGPGNKALEYFANIQLPCDPMTKYFTAHIRF
jgi:ABC-type multidrug transport system ATPase subunit